jgi:hypothetical protein
MLHVDLRRPVARAPEYAGGLRAHPDHFQSDTRQRCVLGGANDTINVNGGYRLSTNGGGILQDDQTVIDLMLRSY